ncbi:MAG: thioredoxin family protein [Bacteroidota bacterium]
MNYNSKSHQLTSDAYTNLKAEWVIILVTRASSGTSFMMQLVMDSLRQKYEDSMKFFDYPIEEFQHDYGAEIQVEKTPTTLLFQNDELQHQFEGLTSIEELENVLLNQHPILSF